MTRKKLKIRNIKTDNLMIYDCNMNELERLLLLIVITVYSIYEANKLHDTACTANVNTTHVLL